MNGALHAGVLLLLAAAFTVVLSPMPDSGAASVHAGAQALAFEPELFLTSDRCIACHKGVSTPEGTDVSIGYDWRASMMANSARDPYWHAAVRREVMDFPGATASIETKCSRCHMPMASEVDLAAGRVPGVFANLAGDGPAAALAMDGVSCSACHQITPDRLGTEASFTGGFVIDTTVAADGRPVYGPFEADAGGAGIMHSATGFRPQAGAHVQTSELCATCHTLFTHTLRPDGTEGGEFPEQTPYLEWEASAFSAEGRTCQDCHMPEVEPEVPVTSVLGRARPNVSRHVFRGGNFFMLRVLNRYRQELGVRALPQELALAADRTEQHLRESTARLAVESTMVLGDKLHADVLVTNQAGHRFPTAYPSRRAWIHLTVRDGDGTPVFESGAFQRDGRITGNDNDSEPATFEPHYLEVTSQDQVQIYEGIMVDESGNTTTGLMSAARWAKDNRLLPRGYRPEVDSRIAVRGAATLDADFEGGSDRIRYSVDIADRTGPFTVDAELWFQPIAFRWAENLSEYEAFETQRFLRYYRDMSSGSGLLLTTVTATVR